MLFKLKSSYLIVLLFMFVSCIRTEEVVAPWNQTNVPVLFSILTPGKQVIAYMGESNQAIDTMQEISYPDARLYIRETAGKWFEMERLEHTNKYELVIDSLQIKKGASYQIKAELGQGLATLLASTSIPEENAGIETASYYITDTLVYHTWKGISYRGIFKARWKILPKKEYGYVLLDEDWDIKFVRGETECKVYENDYVVNKDSSSINLFLITTDPILNTYLKSLAISEAQHSQSDDFISVLLSSNGATIPSFNNISNGIGLFGSYVQSRTRVKVEQYEK